MKSKAWKWNSADTKAWAMQTLKTLAPYLIALIPVIIGELPKEATYTVAIAWILNRILSYLLILKAGK